MSFYGQWFPLEGEITQLQHKNDFFEIVTEHAQPPKITWARQSFSLDLHPK